MLSELSCQSCCDSMTELRFMLSSALSANARPNFVPADSSAFGAADSEADRAALTELQQQVAELQSANAELKEEADSSWAELNAKEEVSKLGGSLFVQAAAHAS